MKKEKNTCEIMMKKFKETSITETEALFNYYMPVEKISGNSITYKNFKKSRNKRVVDTQYGRIEYRNRLLCEYHQRVVTAIIHFGEIKMLENGSLASIFRERDIMDALGFGDGNYAAFREVVKVISDAQYYITTNATKGGTITRRVSIFKEHILHENSNSKMQGVVFDAEYTRMHKSDFSLSLYKIFKKMACIPYPTMQSILIYLMFRNKDLQDREYKLDEVLTNISFPTDSPTSIKTVKANLKQFKAVLKSDYGVEYCDKRHIFTCGEIKGVKYIEVPTSSIEAIKSFKGKVFNHEKGNFIIKDIISLNRGNNHWLIKTNKEDIEIEAFPSDLMFLLEQTTEEVKKEDLDLFSMLWQHD